jgi:ubiquinone/menaquinone biosynthesis C-methylase UbiE
MKNTLNGQQALLRQCLDKKFMLPKRISPIKKRRWLRGGDSVSLKKKIIALAERRPFVKTLIFYYFCYGRKELTPPQLFNFVGGQEFEAIGKHYFKLMIGHGGLAPSQKILDIGCGIGRVAMNFIDYLDSNGRYEGFDIVKFGPQWCNAKITRKYKAFSFRHVNVFNKEYNPKGTIAACDFVFPYRDGRFDFAFATSVFTHMLPDAVYQYLVQTHRVLRRSGILFASFFILNDHSRKHKPTGSFDFREVDEHYGVMSEENPEEAIAYDEDYLEAMITKAGFQLTYPRLYGNWSGREGLVHGQDILIMKKG